VDAVHVEELEQELALSEDERVILWRVDMLERAGYDDEAAVTLALRRDVDLHLAVELVARGCPHATALRILI